MNVQIVYFSGTGCTEHVAKTFSKEFQARGHTTLCRSITKTESPDESTDLLVLCFAVHASNAPEPVMRWVKNLEKADERPVVIISISGGGEVTPNLACRVPLKRAFKRKNYRLLYEKMLVMPSNWIVGTKRVLSSKLLQVLPYKVSYVVNDVLNGKGSFTHPLLGNRFLTFIGSLEHVGARSFGKKILVDKSCTLCGLCVKRCPVSNISLHGDRPVFGKNCTLCLNCIYSCPQGALHPGTMKFVVIKKGFSFQEILALPSDNLPIDLDKEAKGFAWVGVKRYLSKTSDMLEPAFKGPLD